MRQPQHFPNQFSQTVFGCCAHCSGNHLMGHRQPCRTQPCAEGHTTRGVSL